SPPATFKNNEHRDHRPRRNESSFSVCSVRSVLMGCAARNAPQTPGVSGEYGRRGRAAQGREVARLPRARACPAREGTMDTRSAKGRGAMREGMKDKIAHGLLAAAAFAGAIWIVAIVSAHQ